MLANRLKNAREILGKTQKEMALIINVSLTAWQNYESGKQFPGGKVFEEFAKLGFDVNWLLTGDGPMRREENSSLQINGNKNFQVNGSVVHAVHSVFAKEERESRAPEPGLASEPPPAAALDPLDAAYLDDWHKLSEVGKMRVWTIVKEEIEKERKGEK